MQVALINQVGKKQSTSAFIGLQKHPEFFHLTQVETLGNIFADHYYDVQGV